MTSKDFWEKNAQPWNRAIQSHLIESRKVTDPAIVKTIIRHKPASILDLGCGEGWIASQVLPLGIQYTGLDFSSKLIELARKSHPSGSFETIGYDELIRGDWKNPLLYDAAVFNFSLFDENLAPLLRKVASILKPHGAMIIQTLHPKTALDPYQDGWKIEDFKTFPIPFEGTMRWYGRRLESWEKTFSDSGLKIQETIEPISPETKKPLSIIFSLKAK